MSIVDIPESCMFNMDIISDALAQHNMDTSALAGSFVHRKLSIGLSAFAKIVYMIIRYTIEYL